MRSTAVRVLIPLAIAGVAACGGRYLRWNAQGPAPAVAGKVDITVADHREEKKGGADPRLVGNERNGWGIPFAIRVRTPTEVSESVRDLLGQAALTAGVGVTAMGDQSATAKLAVEIQQMWCDGYPPAYKANLLASVALLGPDGQVRVPGMPLASDGAHMNCQGAYQNALTRAYEAAVAMMSAQPFKDAATGAGGAPPPSSNDGAGMQ
jgi:hypothetical protein